MGLSTYEMSYPLTMIVALVVVYGAVLRVVMGFVWWLCRYQRSVGFARRRRDRIGPVGIVGGV